MRYFATEGTEVGLFGFLFLEEQICWIPAVLAAVRCRAGPCCMLTVCATAALKPRLGFAVIFVKRRCPFINLIANSHFCFPGWNADFY